MVIRILLVLILLVVAAIPTSVFFPKNAEVLSALTSQKQTEKIPPVTQAPLPSKKVIANNYHIFQSFNNCGPASLSLALSYFKINKSQEELGAALRPYQIDGGIEDDKSVTFSEMSKKAEEYGLVTYHRPNGNMELVKKFIAADIPVMTRTWLDVNDDIGHYRVIKGYDDTAKTILQDDTYQGKNLTYAYEDFDTLWSKYNYEYLVLVPQDKKELAENILGENIDEQYAWEESKKLSLEKLSKDPTSIYDRFNLSVAYYHLGDKKKTIEEYEKVASELPFRTLWYQTEPIQAYFDLGQYDQVLAISDQILNNQNRAFSELYLMRGKIFEKRGDKIAARIEYENAVFYNSELKPAKEALDNV